MTTFQEPTDDKTTSAPSTGNDKLSPFEKIALGLFGVGIVSICGVKIAAHHNLFEDATNVVANAVHEYHDNAFGMGVAVGISGLMLFAAKMIHDGSKEEPQTKETPNGPKPV